ncbi:hypothetical protein [Parafrankia sp. FMc2]|uniref:hypothetical protein n=1 Tax=Parafrankia sp. FMc2 TaxID=3233196 RepID=UPI0034D584B9
MICSTARLVADRAVRHDRTAGPLLAPGDPIVIAGPTHHVEELAAVISAASSS